MADNDKKSDLIIIKKIKKAGHEGSHGGSWKIAYADFVTAMMAFFMLMWLLNVTSEEQRKGIADYFSPNLINMKSRNGGGGMMGGINVSNANNSNGKGVDPSPVEKPEEIIVEDVANNMMSETIKKEENNENLVYKNQTGVSKKIEKLSKPQTSSANSIEQKPADPTMLQSQNNIEQKNNPMPSPQDKPQTTDGQKKITQNSSSIANKEASASNNGAEATATDKAQQISKTGKSNPAKDMSAKMIAASQDEAQGENIANGKNEQNKDHVAQGPKNLKPDTNGVQQPAQQEVGQQISDSVKTAQGNEATKGSQESHADNIANASEKGQNRPAHEAIGHQSSHGVQKAMGEQIAVGKNQNYSEMSGSKKPTYNAEGSMIAKGHEISLVPMQNNTEKQGHENITNQDQKKNIQDGTDKARSTGQNGGRNAQPSQQGNTKNKANQDQNSQNMTKQKNIDNSHLIAFDKEQNLSNTEKKDIHNNKDKNQAPLFSQKSPENQAQSPISKQSNQNILQQAQLLDRAIRIETQKAAQRLKTTMYQRTIHYAKSLKTQKQDVKNKKAMERLKAKTDKDVNVGPDHQKGHETSKAKDEKDKNIGPEQQTANEKLKAKNDTEKNIGPQNQTESTDEKALEALQAMEENQLRETMAQIVAMVSQNPEFKGLMPHLVTEIRPEGLRIQLIDQEKESMFPSGSSTLLPSTKKLLTLIAKLIAPLSNPLIIAGHTDSRPFLNPSVYSNWELSADRANATRRALVAHGVSEERFESVMGKESTEPFLPNNPTAAPNRRISITLIRQFGMPDSAEFANLTHDNTASNDNAQVTQCAGKDTSPQKNNMPPHEQNNKTEEESASSKPHLVESSTLIETVKQQAEPTKP